MKSILKTFEQEAWHDNLPVSIHTDGTISVNGEQLITPKEQALGWTILRLNAQAVLLQKEIEKNLIDFMHIIWYALIINNKEG